MTRMSTDRWVAVLLLVLVLAYWSNAESYEKVLRADIMGPTFFPRIISVLGVVLAAWLFCSRQTGQAAGEGEGWPWSEAEKLFPLGMFFVFALLIQPIGFIPSTLAYLAVSLKYLGQPTWAGSLAIAVGLTAAVYALFGIALGIPLPDGVFLKDML